VECLADISEPQVPPNEHNDQRIQFSLFFSQEKAISPIETVEN